MHGMGNATNLVMELTLQRSIHNWMLPSDFSTPTVGLPPLTSGFGYFEALLTLDPQPQISFHGLSSSNSSFDVLGDSASYQGLSSVPLLVFFSVVLHT